MKCINTSHPDFKRLLEESKIPSDILAGYVSVYMDTNNSDKIPDFGELDDMMREFFRHIAAEERRKAKEGKSPLRNDKNEPRFAKFFPTDSVTSEFILEKITETKHPLAPLAEKLLSLNMPSIDVSLVYNVSYLGVFSPNLQSIGINYNGDYSDYKGESPIPTIIHEILHAYTHGNIEMNDSPYIKDLQAIFDHAKKFEVLFDDVYPLTDLHEFIVGIYTRPKFIRGLKKVPPLVGLKTKHNSLWEDFIKWVRDWMGFNDSSALKQAIDISTHIIPMKNPNHRASGYYYNTSSEVYTKNELHAVYEKFNLIKNGQLVSYGNEVDAAKRVKGLKKSSSFYDFTYRKTYPGGRFTIFIKKPQPKDNSIEEYYKSGKAEFDRAGEPDFDGLYNIGTSNKAFKGLDARISNWLDLMGISMEKVSQITGKDGNTAINAVAKISKGVIQYVEDKLEQDTLPEEASHFMTAILKEHNRSLYNSLAYKAKQSDIYEQVKVDYAGVYDTEDQFVEEAVGKIMALYLLGERPEIKSLMDKVKDFIKRFLNSVGINMGTYMSELDPYVKATDMMLSAEQSDFNKDSLESVKKTYEGIEYYDLTDKQQRNYDTFLAKLTDLMDPAKSPVEKVKEGYRHKTTGKITARVTNIVKEYYKSIFPGGDNKGKKALMAAMHGTKLHRTYEIISQAYVKGDKIPTHAEITKQLYEEFKDHPDFKDFDQTSSAFRFGTSEEYSSSSYDKIQYGIKSLIDGIKAKGDAIAKATGTKNETKFFFELTMYDELEDISGTIDMVVLYPDGSIANYDYKNMSFKTARGKIVNDFIAPYLATAFSIQLENYKDLQRHALAGLDGDITFAETRIIPIDMRLSYKDPSIIYSVDIGEENLEGDTRRHLRQIPVARELTGHKSIDEGLTAMYDLEDKLAKMMEDNPRDASLKFRSNAVRDTIQTFLVYDKADDIAGKIKTLKDEYKVRSMSAPSKNVHMQLIDEYYSYAKVYYKLLEGLVERAGTISKDTEDDKVKDVNNKIEASLQKVYFETQNFIKELNSKSQDILNDIDNRRDLDESTKELSFFGRMFKQLSQINHPAFQRLATLVGRVKTDVQIKVDEFNEELKVKVGDLEKHAEATGTTVQKIYEKIINSKTGNLVTKFKSTLYDEKAKAQEDKDDDWLSEHLEIDYDSKLKRYKYTGASLTKFNEARARYMKYLNELYKGDTKNMIDIRNQALADWDFKYNILTSESALHNKKNWYLNFKEKEEHFSEDWKYIKANKPVEEYYKFYVESNKKFADLTGKDIRDNFVANIHADVIDAALNNGIGASLNMRNHLRDMLRVRQYDTVKGAIDPDTGKAIQNIPLMYYDGLRKSASTQERLEIENELVNSGYIRGEQDYIIEFQKRIRSLERRKAARYKSKDLSRSLSLFAEAAYTNYFYKESESMANGLLTYFKDNNSGIITSDHQGKTVVDKFTKKVKEIFKVSSNDVDALESFIDLYWYGRTIQTEDAISRREIKDSEGNVIDTEYFSTIKGIKKMMQYISLKSLGLNAFSAFGNAVGIGANTYFLGRENRELTRESLWASIEDYRKDREQFSAMAEIVKPYTHGVNYEAANNLTSSKLNKILTQDNMYFMMKNPDMFIDKLITNSMARTYGINESGGVIRLALDPKAKPIIDLLTKDDKGNFELGLDEDQLTIFRRKVQAAATKIKGSMPQENKALWTTNLITVMMGQFRGWMPGLIRARFKTLQHDSDLDELDVGRYRVFIGEMIGEGFSLKNILNLANRIIPFYDKRTKGLKKISEAASRKYFEEFKLNNPTEYNNFLKSVSERHPNLSLTEIKQKAFEEFMDMREAKVTSFISELKALMYISMLMLGIGAAAPDDDEFLKSLARNSMLMLQRGYLELSFFYDMNTPKTLLSNPIPAMRFVFDTQKAMGNFIDETATLVSGIEDPQDHTPYMYYTSTKLLPFFGMLNKIFDPFDNYDNY